MTRCHTPNRSRFTSFLLLGWSCFGASLALAQTAPQPAPAPAATEPAGAIPTGTEVGPTAPTPKNSDIVQLTPFEVPSGRDNGYYASDTLSGTRIDSKVADLGASITVVTKQQLLDTAAVDINDIFSYEANTEGINDYTATSSSSPTNDQIQGSPQTAVRISGLGPPNIERDGFFMTSRIPIDTYNIDSVEISRGPSSTLAGLGAPSGTVNINTASADLVQETNSTTFRVDSYGGYRWSLDVNRPLFRDKLAVRVALLYSNQAYERKPSYDDQRRLYGAVTYKPFPTTTIRFQYEHYLDDRQTPNYLTPRDGVSEWVADGKPIWNPLTYTASVNGQNYVLPESAAATLNNAPGTTNALPAGLFYNSTNLTRPSMYIDGGQVQLWEVNRLIGTNFTTQTGNQFMLAGSGTAIMRGDVNAGGEGYQVLGISNKSLYDWTKTNAVPEDWNYDHASLYTAILEQKLITDMYFRAGYHLEASDSYNRNIVNPPTLEIDTNSYLLDGRSNPYFLRPFYQVNEPSIYRTPEYNQTMQAQLTYDLNFQKLFGGKGPAGIWKWLGDHRMLGYYEGRGITDYSIRYREAIIDANHAWLTPGALNFTNGVAEDRPTYRYYVGPPGALGFTPGFTPPKSGVQGTFNINYNAPGSTTSWISEPAQFGAAPYVGSQTEQEIVSHGAALQSSFLDDRIVFTGGLRNDFNRTRNSDGATINPTTGLYDYGNENNQWASWTDARGKTRTVSLVIKPLPWIGLLADKSDSFQPQGPAIDLNDNPLPNTYGHGYDYGFYLSFFHDKFHMRLSAYHREIDNNRDSDSTIGSRVIRLEDSTTSSDPSLYNWAVQTATALYGTATSSQALNYINNLTNFSPTLQNVITAYNAGASVRGTDTSVAKGAELEMDFNPSYNWVFRFTGAQTKAVNTSLENDIAGYLAARLPYWQSVNDGQGNYWWTSTQFTPTSAQTFYTTNILDPVQLDQALLGKSNPQVKEYTWRLLTKYNFTGSLLKNVSVGGSLRWDSKSSIGYLGSAPDPDGIVRSLNVNASVYDPARYSGTMFASYRTKIFSGKVRVLFQINYDNAFQKAGLQPTAVNPDGSVYNYRIIDPGLFIFTTTFNF